MIFLSQMGDSGDRDTVSRACCQARLAEQGLPRQHPFSVSVVVSSDDEGEVKRCHRGPWPLSAVLAAERSNEVMVEAAEVYACCIGMDHEGARHINEDMLTSLPDGPAALAQLGNMSEELLRSCPEHDSALEALASSSPPKDAEGSSVAQEAVGKVVKLLRLLQQAGGKSVSPSCSRSRRGQAVRDRASSVSSLSARPSAECQVPSLLVDSDSDGEAATGTQGANVAEGFGAWKEKRRTARCRPVWPDRGSYGHEPPQRHGGNHTSLSRQSFAKGDGGASKRCDAPCVCTPLAVKASDHSITKQTMNHMYAARGDVTEHARVLAPNATARLLFDPTDPECSDIANAFAKSSSPIAYPVFCAEMTKRDGARLMDPGERLSSRDPAISEAAPLVKTPSVSRVPAAARTPEKRTASGLQTSPSPLGSPKAACGRGVKRSREAAKKLRARSPAEGPRSDIGHCTPQDLFMPPTVPLLATWRHIPLSFSDGDKDAAPHETQCELGGTNQCDDDLPLSALVDPKGEDVAPFVRLLDSPRSSDADDGTFTRATNTLMSTMWDAPVQCNVWDLQATAGAGPVGHLAGVGSNSEFIDEEGTTEPLWCRASFEEVQQSKIGMPFGELG